MKPIDTTMKLMLVFAVTDLIFLQVLSLPGNGDSSSNNDNSRNYLAFALTNGQPITQKLNYAHFLPLTNNIKLHQVKVIVDYAPIGAAQNASMKVYATNGTLIKISSFPSGLKTTATGKAQFATSLSDSTVKQVTAHIMFTDSSEFQFLKSNKCQAEPRLDYSTIIINDNTPLSQSYRGIVC